MFLIQTATSRSLLPGLSTGQEDVIQFPLLIL